MAVMSYKCPNCGAGLTFDPKTQQLRCEYCLSEFTEEEMKALEAEEAKKVETSDETEQSAAEDGGNPEDAGNKENEDAQSGDAAAGDFDAEAGSAETGCKGGRVSKS